MQREIAKYYQRHLIDVKLSTEKSHKLREDYILSCVKKIDVNHIKRKILLTTKNGLSALKIFSVPTRSRKWYSKKDSWSISSHRTLAKILDEKGIRDELSQLFDIPELEIHVKHSRLAGHEYHVYDVMISWLLYIDLVSK